MYAESSKNNCPLARKALLDTLYLVDFTLVG